MAETAKTTTPEVKPNTATTVATTTPEVKPTGNTVEATVAPKETLKKVVCLQDHTCTIGNDTVIVEKGKDYNLREDIAYALQERSIVMVK